MLPRILNRMNKLVNVKTIRSFTNKDRRTLIEYKTKKTNKFNKSIFFVSPFNSDFNIFACNLIIIIVIVIIFQQN